MKLSELKQLLTDHADRFFRIRLPDGSAVPLSFHVTEVGLVQKKFLDCGGTLRETSACQLQIWVGEDYDHRIETSKMAAILEKAKPYLQDEDLPVEIEYEDRVISQYTIEGWEQSDDAVVLQLAHKHTDCLAREICGLPPSPQEVKSEEAAACCSPQGCC